MHYQTHYSHPYSTHMVRHLEPAIVSSISANLSYLSTFKIQKWALHFLGNKKHLPAHTKIMSDLPCKCRKSGWCLDCRFKCTLMNQSHCTCDTALFLHHNLMPLCSIGREKTCRCNNVECNQVADHTPEVFWVFLERGIFRLSSFSEEIACLQNRNFHCHIRS